MEKDTINLSLKDYNELRDFKKAIESYGGVQFYWSGFSCSSTIYTKNQAIIKISEANIRLSLRIKELENPKTHQPTYSEIKKMNWWQFRKFKR